MTTVYNGTWTVRGDGTGFPNPFNDVLVLADSFKYDPSKGDLIVEIDVHSSDANF